MWIEAGRFARDERKDDVYKLPEVIEEHVMRCQVTGGFVEVRFRHKMSAEDIADLRAYLEVWERHLAKEGRRGFAYDGGGSRSGSGPIVEQRLKQAGSTG